ncbi:hypothetical protein [Streptomyces sp. NBC_00280]|uniref:hypothetical protein n=1 Tax=Streptomyces sp. NBC_00280 TaxID=2975699 RepID=UPI002F910A16
MSTVLSRRVPQAPSPAGTLTPLVRQLSAGWDAPHAHRRLMLVIADDADAVRLL